MTDLKILAKTIGAVIHGGVHTEGCARKRSYQRRFAVTFIKTVICAPILLVVPGAAAVKEEVEKPVETRERPEPKPNTGAVFVFCKRAFDVVASALALIILSPIFLITAIAIKLEDHGPVFYSNYLVGKDEKKFPIHKFRSMYVNAAEINVSAHEQKDAAGITFKLAHDPRVTKVGKVIRRTCIDELPQLLNILKGEMSFVGPRPLPPYAYAQLSEYDRNRYKVKGGLLCFWQISDRSKVSFEEWMDMDIRYVNEASVWTDFKILLMTVPAVFMTIWKNY